MRLMPFFHHGGLFNIACHCSPCLTNERAQMETDAPGSCLLTFLRTINGDYSFTVGALIVSDVCQLDFHCIAFLHQQQRTGHRAIVGPVLIGDTGSEFGDNFAGFKFYYNRSITSSFRRRCEVIACATGLRQCLGEKWHICLCCAADNSKEKEECREADRHDIRRDGRWPIALYRVKAFEEE